VSHIKSLLFFAGNGIHLEKKKEDIKKERITKEGLL